MTDPKPRPIFNSAPFEVNFHHFFISFNFYLTFIKFSNPYNKFQWCSFMRSKKANPIARAVLGVIKKSIPQLMKPCPFAGHIELNVSLEQTKNLVFMAPPGKYLVGEKMHNDDFGDFFEINFVIELV
jgi:hypothetical protein